MKMGRRSRVGRDLVVVSIAVWLVFAVTFVVGRAVMPSVPGFVITTPGGADIALVDRLRADLAAMADPAAVIEVSGAVQQRLVLDHVDVPFVFAPLGMEYQVTYGPDMPVDLDARYSSGGATLTMVAANLEAGLSRTEAMTVVFTYEGRSFVAHSGDCRLELSRSGYVSEEAASGFMLYWPTFVGHVVCTAVADVRGGETISFTAVFDHRAPH